MVHQKEAALAEAMGLNGGRLRGVIGQKRKELGKPVGIGANESVVDAAFSHEHVGDGVEQPEVGLGAKLHMIGRGDGRLGATWIEHDDARRVFVHHHALPHDGVRDGRIGPDKDQAVGVLEIGVGVGRRVEAERLFISDGRRGHALAGVAVEMQRAHAEFKEGPEKRHFLGRDLAGGETRHAVRAVCGLDGLKARREGGGGGGPVGRKERSAR
jgi:hypothetical protein